MTPTPSSSVECTFDGRVAWVALDDPARRNALSLGMFDRLSGALDQVTRRDDVAVAVIYGRGAAFCSGFDLKAALIDPSLLSEFILRLADLLRQIRLMPQVVVAAVHGAAIAGGSAIVSGCDIVVVSASAKLGYPVHRLGLSPAVTTSTLLQKLTPGAARALLVGGEPLDGAEAVERGLAHVLSAGDESVLEDATALARTIAGHGAAALRATKRWLNQLDGSLDESRTRRPAEHSARNLDDVPALLAAYLRTP